MQLKPVLREVQKHLVKILSSATRCAFILSWHSLRGQNMVCFFAFFLLLNFFLPNKYSWHLHLVCHGKKMWGGLFLSYFLTWFNKNQRIKTSFSSLLFLGWFTLFCTLYIGNVSEYMQDVQRMVYAQNSAGFPEVWSASTRGWLDHIKERNVPVFSALNWIFPRSIYALMKFSGLVTSARWFDRSQETRFCRFPARCLTASPWAQPQELLCKVDVRKYLTNSARPTAGERRAAGKESRRGGLIPTSSGSRSFASLRVNAAETVDGPFRRVQLWPSFMIFFFRIASAPGWCAQADRHYSSLFRILDFYAKKRLPSSKPGL